MPNSVIRWRAPSMSTRWIWPAGIGQRRRDSIIVHFPGVAELNDRWAVALGYVKLMTKCEGAQENWRLSCFFGCRYSVPCDKLLRR